MGLFACVRKGLVDTDSRVNVHAINLLLDIMTNHYKDFTVKGDDFEYETSIIDLLLLKLAKKEDKLLHLLSKNCLEKISHNKFMGYYSQIERIIYCDVLYHSPTQLVEKI